MHLTLKQETIRPAALTFLQQQQRFDDFIGVYNNQRPHQALGVAYPGDVYAASPRAHEPPEDPQYPYHERTVRVTRYGRICIDARIINFSVVFAGQLEEVRQVTGSGRSTSWSMSWVTSTTNRIEWNPDRIPSPRTKC